jgi:hypothetical protein
VRVRGEWCLVCRVALYLQAAFVLICIDACGVQITDPQLPGVKLVRVIDDFDLLYCISYRLMRITVMLLV